MSRWRLLKLIGGRAHGTEISDPLGQRVQVLPADDTVKAQRDATYERRVFGTQHGGVLDLFVAKSLSEEDAERILWEGLMASAGALPVGPDGRTVEIDKDLATGDHARDLRRIRGGLVDMLEALEGGDLARAHKLLRTAHGYVDARLPDDGRIVAASGEGTA